MRNWTLAGLLAVAGCTDVAPCKQGTLFLSVTLDGAAANADHLVIDVSVDGGGVSETVLPHTSGVASGAIEVDFPRGYPSGSKVRVDVTATANGLPVAAGSVSSQLAARCAALAVTVSGALLQDLSTLDTSIDLAKNDMPPDMASSDMSPDFASSDGSPDLAWSDMPSDLPVVSYAVGGIVTGLSGSGLVIGNSVNGGTAEQLAISHNGTFVFPTPAPSGAAYAVSVITQPGAPAQTCTVTASSGNATADVTTVQIVCPPFVVANGLDTPNALALNGSTLYFAVGLYPSVADCYTANPTAGDRLLMVSTAGGTPSRIDYVDNSGGNCGLYGLSFDSTYVYWTNYPTGNIKRATLAGASPSLVATVQGYNNALALGGGNLYWHSYPNMSIGVVSTSGTGNTTFSSAASSNGQNLTTDANNVYWTDYSAGTVNKVPFNATPLPASPTILAPSETMPNSPFVTASNIYWLQPGASGALRYAALASPSAMTLNTAPLVNPGSVVVDASYAWVLAAGSSDTDGRIYRIPVGGGAPVLVAQGLYKPNSLTMDAGHLYWLNYNTTQASGTRNSDGTIMMIVK
jgi:hypothetical protein